MLQLMCDDKFVADILTPWLASGCGLSENRVFTLGKDHRKVLLERLEGGWPTAIVIRDLTGGEVEVVPIKHRLLLVIVDGDGEIIHELDNALTEAVRAHTHQ